MQDVGHGEIWHSPSAMGGGSHPHGGLSDPTGPVSAVSAGSLATEQGSPHQAGGKLGQVVTGPEQEEGVVVYVDGFAEGSAYGP